MKHRTLVGTLLSLIWLGLFVWAIVEKREAVSILKLNEWGDFFAGFAAPLALLWLVLGYLQQGEELEQNTAALLGQRDEFQRQVAETQNLVEASKRQAKASEELLAASKAELDEQKRLATAQSLMELRHQGTHGTAETNLTLSLKNTGAPGRSLVVQVSPIHRVHLANAEFVDTGTSLDLSIFGPIIFPVQIHFRYSNRYRQEVEQVYQLSGLSEFSERA
jgi:hypothetical protein